MKPNEVVIGANVKGSVYTLHGVSLGWEGCKGIIRQYFPSHSIRVEIIHDPFNSLAQTVVTGLEYWELDIAVTKELLNEAAALYKGSPPIQEKPCQVCNRANDIGIKSCWNCGNIP